MLMRGFGKDDGTFGPMESLAGLSDESKRGGLIGSIQQAHPWETCCISHRQL